MRNYYNLLDEAWIPCKDLDNNLNKISLAEAINHAHLYRQVEADLPTVTAALNLLLIAFALSIYQPKDIENWRQLYLKGSFPTSVLDSYIQTWHGRFDLFDASFPFYQDAQLGVRKRDKAYLGANGSPIPKGFAGQLLQFSSGSNPTLFDHTMDADKRMFELDEAARLLVMIQAYSLGGMGSASIGNDKYYKDSTFCRGILFLCRGGNLFETIMQNLIPEELDYTGQMVKDRPCWEKDDPINLERDVPAGLKDLITWQCRRILLIAESDNERLVVKDCFSAPGMSLPETYSNPFYLNEHRLDGINLKIKPLRFQINRALWRDSSAIMDVRRDKSDKPISKILFEKLRFEEILEDKQICLSLFGICTEPGRKKAYFFRTEEFDAPTIYLEDPDKFEELKSALEMAEGVRKALYFATYELVSYKLRPDQDLNNLKPDKDSISALYDHVNMEHRYWSQLEPHFYTLLDSLPSNPSAVDAWKDTIKKNARESLSKAAQIVGLDYAGLKARARAESKLAFEIYKVFNPNNKEV